MGVKVGTCHLLTNIKLMYPGVTVLGKFLMPVCGKSAKMLLFNASMLVGNGKMIL